MLKISKKVSIGLFLSVIMLSACVWPEKEDPFERLPEEKLETLRGEIFPFSVSVSTQATHRLERNEKLQGYLASKIIRLDDFEGRDVEVDGFWRKAKMKQVFWVEAIRLKDSLVKEDREEPTESIFETKRFLFTYPVNWDYTTSPDGVAYFLDKKDQSRRVFLTFSVKDISKEDKKIDPNVLIANMAGTKTITKDKLKRDREEIILLSNVYDKKYSFIFTTNFEDFERKKEFFKLLNSFIEGDDVVQKYKDDKQAELANKEKEKLETEQKAAEELAKTKELERLAEEANEEKEDGFISKIFDSKETEITEIEKIIEPEKIKEPIVVKAELGDFKNLIDNRSFAYSSTHYDLAFKVPYGYWYQNFGPEEGVLTSIGFSDHAFGSKSEIKFWLKVISGEQVDIVEEIRGDILTVKYPKDKNTHFEFIGSTKFRDVMFSVLGSMED